jgi:hypothetical protein
MLSDLDINDQIYLPLINKEGIIIQFIYINNTAIIYLPSEDCDICVPLNNISRKLIGENVYVKSEENEVLIKVSNNSSYRKVNKIDIWEEGNFSLNIFNIRCPIFLNNGILIDDNVIVNKKSIGRIVEMSYDFIFYKVLLNDATVEVNINEIKKIDYDNNDNNNIESYINSSKILLKYNKSNISKIFKKAKIDLTESQLEEFMYQINENDYSENSMESLESIEKEIDSSEKHQDTEVKQVFEANSLMDEEQCQCQCIIDDTVIITDKDIIKIMDEDDGWVIF